MCCMNLTQVDRHHRSQVQTKSLFMYRTRIAEMKGNSKRKKLCRLVTCTVASICAHKVVKSAFTLHKHKGLTYPPLIRRVYYLWLHLLSNFPLIYSKEVGLHETHTARTVATLIIRQGLSHSLNTNDR